MQRNYPNKLVEGLEKHADKIFEHALKQGELPKGFMRYTRSQMITRYCQQRLESLWAMQHQYRLYDEQKQKEDLAEAIVPTPEEMVKGPAFDMEAGTAMGVSEL